MPSTDPNRGEEAARPAEWPVGFEKLFGLEITETGDGEMRGQVVVRDHHKQIVGIVHGGVYAAIAESLASVGTGLAVGWEGRIIAGMTNSTSFLRPITEGTIHAVARARHRGRTTWVWDVDLSDDAERVAAISRVTIAVRDL